MIDFAGQVAIVTGAGRGIGRETALALARRGAHVLVNDYGGGGDTISPGDIGVAQSVVDEIVGAGGQAVADATSVGTGAGADAIVRHAMAAFGRVDILVNNAGGSLGIIALEEDTDEQVEGVLRTNLIGPYMLIRRVWPIMRQQGHGRVVNVLSGAMVGMAGTAAYSAGKSGLIGLTNTAAIEGAAHGILVNGVWPIAYTRLAGKLEDAAMFEWMKQFPPGLVAEAIVYLCSNANGASGEMFSVGGGRVGRNALFGAPGFYDADLTAETLAANIATARDLTGASVITTTAGEMQRFG